MKNELKISTLIDASVSEVWNRFTTPSNIMNWNNASEDWHTPRAENNLREGGRFNFRMESRDGNYGFDFSGVYTKIIPYALIEYVMDDNRKVSNTFSSGKNGITVQTTFEAEGTYTLDKQREGWQAILDNFKKYVENKTNKMKQQPIIPCLWFNNQAEEAVKFYMSVFKDSKIGDIMYYTEAGHEIHGHEAGTIVTIDFWINGQQMTALNGGAEFKFTEAVSLQVLCETQAEIDYYWDKLTDGGEEGVCGWLKDKFGLSWQVAPTILTVLLKDPLRAEKVTEAYLKMKKFDIETLLKV